MAVYMGSGGGSLRVGRIYIGVNGKAARVRNVYIGVNGKAVPLMTPVIIELKKIQNRNDSEGDESLLTVGGYVLSVGGRYGKTAVNAFDGNLTETAAPGLFEGRYGMGAARAGTTGIFAGGAAPSGPSRTADCYNEDLTSYRGSIDGERSFPIGLTAGSYALFAGGRGTSGKLLSSVLAYDSRLVKSYAGSMDEGAYMAGGTGAACGRYALIKMQSGSLAVYDMKNMVRVTSPEALPAGLSSAASASGDKYAVFSGGMTDGTYRDEVWAYNQDLLTVRSRLSSPRANHTGGEINGNIVFFGGGGSTNDMKSVDVFDSSLVLTRGEDENGPYGVSSMTEFGASAGDYIFFRGKPRIGPSGGTVHSGNTKLYIYRIFKE